MSNTYLCPFCHREYESKAEIDAHTVEECQRNRLYDERYRRREDAKTQIMHNMRTLLGDPDPGDPTKVHVRGKGDSSSDNRE